MKKVLTILLVAAMLIQSSVAVMALSAEKDVLTDVTLSVSPSEIVAGKSFNFTADIAMQALKDKFKAGLEIADAYCAGYYVDPQAQADAKAAMRLAAMKGEFTLVLTYPDAITIPASVTQATEMNGFNEEAKEIFVETNRSVAASEGVATLTITIKVKDGLTVGELESKLDEYLADMTFTAKGLVARNAVKYTMKGELTGSVECDYTSADTNVDIDGTINFIKGEGVSIDVNVLPAGGTSNRPSYGGGGYYVPDYDDEEDVNVAEWPFTDVKEGDWFYDAVAYTYANDIFNGTTDTTFEPDLAITRGMMVALIARIEKVSDAAITAASFTDVAQNEYYAAAIDWATENKIVQGYGDGTFGPNDKITREQLATIWYRYQQYKGAVAAGDTNVALTFADAAQVSDYAVDAVKFCFNKGVITGKGNNILDPAGSATRAEVATVLMRYLNK